MVAVLSRTTEKLAAQNREYFRRPYSTYPSDDYTGGSEDDYRGMMSGVAFSLVDKETPGGVPHSVGIKPYQFDNVGYAGMEYQHPITYKRVRPRFSTPVAGDGVTDESRCPHIEIDSGPVWLECNGKSYKFFGVLGVPPYHFFIVSGPGGIDGASGVYTPPACEGECDDNFLQKVVKVGMTDACRKKTFSSTQFFIRSPEGEQVLNVACTSCSDPVTDGDQVDVGGGTPPYKFAISKASINEDTGVISDTTGVCGVAKITVTDSDCLTGELDVRMPVGSWVLQSSWNGTCTYSPGNDIVCIVGGTRLVQQHTVWDDGTISCIDSGPDDCMETCAARGDCALAEYACDGTTIPCTHVGGGNYLCHCRRLYGEEIYTWECP